MKCKVCGQSNPRDAVYCYNCGIKLETRGSGRIALIIGAATLIILVVAIFVLIPDGDGDKSDLSSENTETVKTMEAGDTNHSESASPYFLNVYASSVLAPQYGYTYEPENVFDGDMTTAWVEGAFHTGEGEWIELSAAENQTVNGIEIVNGYCKSEEVYVNNSRIREAQITFDDGSYENIFLKDEFARYQTFNFSSPKSTTIIKVQIISIYEGSKYEDTCISEIKVY